jgi:hypothetical protein
MMAAANLRAIVHLVNPPIDEGLEGVAGEYREVALRFRRLLPALKMTHDAFAKASNTVRRTEVSVAWNGGQLAKTNRWIEAVQNAAAVDFKTANDYLRGRIGLDELLAVRDGRTLVPTKPHVLNLPELSSGAAEAMRAFTWDGTPADEYDRVHIALAAQHFADGRDRVASWWTSEIRRILGENRPTAKSVPGAIHTDSAEDRDAAELAAEKKKQAEETAERDAKAKRKKR